MQDFVNFKKNFVFLNAGVALGVALILWLLGHSGLAMGLVLGAAVAVLSFWAHGNVLTRAFSMPTHRARFYVFFNFLIRYALYFLALMAALQRSHEHFWGAAIGLLIPRLVILVFYTFKPQEIGAIFKSTSACSRDAGSREE